MYTKNFYNKDLKNRSRDLRNNMTRAEKKLWFDFFKNQPLKIHRQRPMGNFIVDFYVPKKSLVIEIDGGVHDSHEAQIRDRERTWYLQNNGLQVIRFSNEDVFNNFDYVCSQICVHLNQNEA
jgi:very-short-patch-repair endonuclease